VTKFLALVVSFCFVMVLAISQAAEPASTTWDSPAFTATTLTAAPVAAAAAEPVAATPAASKSFKATFLKAAEKAYRDGEINRWQLARLRMAAQFRPQVLAEAQAAVVDDAVEAGAMKPMGPAELAGFDWTQLLAFIQKLLPLILQIISIFSGL